MKKLIAVTAAFAVVIIALGVVFTLVNSNSSGGSNAEYIVAINEIERLCAAREADSAGEKAAELKTAVQNNSQDNAENYSAAIMTAVCLVFLAVVSSYCYIVIIKPFHRLTGFADRISQGDFDVPLDYGRTDYFGKFTWAFDSMRREITKARLCEKEAIENNKTVIAALSHDIKTPVASIRAYTEGLEAAMDSSPEKRAKYLGVIMRKCDEVTRLTNDMLLHSLSDMDKLKITPERFELCGFVKEVINDISAGKEDITFEAQKDRITVLADRERTAQIIENLVTNARKYAGSNIEITVTANEKYAELHFRDYGKGIPDSDMPFIKNKFYRGHNCGGEAGSGLGLYIVNYIAVQSGGELRLKNLPDGLEAIVSLPCLENC